MQRKDTTTITIRISKKLRAWLEQEIIFMEESSMNNLVKNILESYQHDRMRNPFVFSQQMDPTNFDNTIKRHSIKDGELVIDDISIEDIFIKEQDSTREDK